MAGARKRPNKRGGNYQAWFTDFAGKRKFFVGTTSRTDTLAMARQLEADHKRMRAGLAPLPTSAVRQGARPFLAVMQEYVSWGKTFAHKNGGPWTADHAGRKERYLQEWAATLKLQTLADLDGCLPRIEAALRDMVAQKLAANTLKQRVNALRSFCRWCVKRMYLSEYPLRDLSPVGGTARPLRRALSVAEIARLLAIAPEYRRLLYLTALLSGLRRLELRQLTRRHLDETNGGLILAGAWTKDRKSTFQPLPARLVRRLAEFCDSGAVDMIYQRLAVKFAYPKDALLVVPSHASRWMDEDMQKAGIAKLSREGRMDFHGLRGSYVTLVVESGGNVKEAQRLARHSTPTLTMDKYAHTRDARLGELVETIGSKVIPADFCATDVHQTTTPLAPEERKCLPECILSHAAIERGLCRPGTGPVGVSQRRW